VRVRADRVQLGLDVIGDNVRPTVDRRHFGGQLDEFGRRDIGFPGRRWQAGS
jgi:hypothetical protein